MALTVYIASITGNTEIRKQVQRTLMILDGLGVKFKAIDITQRGNEEHRRFMRENAINDRCDGVPLPPQFFVDDEYLGNYSDFDEAVEDNHLPEFLRLVSPSVNDSDECKDETDEEDDEANMEDEEEDEDDEANVEDEEEDEDDEANVEDEEEDEDDEEIEDQSELSSEEERTNKEIKIKRDTRRSKRNVVTVADEKGDDDDEAEDEDEDEDDEEDGNDEGEDEEEDKEEGDKMEKCALRS